MPHTNRKKKTGAAKTSTNSKPAVVHTKRTEILDDEGWTHIIDTPRSRTRSSAAANNDTDAKPQLQSGDFERNGVWYINRTLDDVKKEFEYWKKGWDGSDAAKTLVELLASGAGGKRIVQDVVVLGLGSLQSARREGRRSCATQLAALQSMVEALGPIEEGRGKVKVVCQDPAFTELDQTFLESLRYEVVETPLAFERVGEETLVFAVHCYKDVYEGFALNRPAMLVGTEVGKFGIFDN